jgi:AcrR family transcriptional regulator
LPRPADPQLEQRVLAAAQKLWARGGERSLTMRAVAKAAGTNTPAVYRRFKNRRDLVRALVEKAQADVGLVIQRSSSLQEICRAVLDYALLHPREYELVASRLAVTRTPRANVEYVVKKAVEWLGGSPESRRSLVIALWSLVHGTAMLLIAEAIPEYSIHVRRAFTSAVDELIRNHRRFGK